MFKFIGDVLEGRLRQIEKSDQITALTPPEKTIVPIMFRRWERLVYQSNASEELTAFDTIMNKIIIIAVFFLLLEYAVNAFETFFACISFAILCAFIFEFFVRLNYRRWRYFTTWGIYVDIPVILIEAVLLYLFYLSMNSVPLGVNFSDGGISLGSVDNHRDAMRVAARFQHAA